MRSRLLLLASVGLALAGCSKHNGGSAANAPPAAGSAAVHAGQGAPADLTMRAVNSAQFSPVALQTPPAANAGGNDVGPPDNETDGYDNTQGNTAGAASPGAPAANPVILKAEVLLDRANVSPGVMDGQMGQNVQNALSAYQSLHNLPVTGALDQATWNSLTAGDQAPVLKVYTLTPQDVAGPWSPDVGEDFVKMSQQSALGYTSPLEMLAARFHMDQALLKTLNPQADLSKAGTQIVVTDPGQGVLPPVDHILVNKAKEEVTAYGADNKVLAVFPATVGSTERPSPKGTWTVKGVAQNPDYTYDPSKLTWGPKKAGKLHIPPGPNNPVGVVWIALTAPDYGIHGTPDPHLIGKTASHGCVRLTNWDAEELSKAVKPGVKVTFVDTEG